MVLGRLPELDTEELYRRLPEIERIEGSLQPKVRGAFLEHVPDYFWYVPASSSGNHHPPDQRGIHGLWLHCRRAATVFERLISSAEQLGLVDRFEVNVGRAAVLLHDAFKYGQLSDEQQDRVIRSLIKTGEVPDGVHTQKDHDVVAATYLRRHTDLPEAVLGCVDTHNGPWYRGGEPDPGLQLVHHFADMIVSDTHVLTWPEHPAEELLETSQILQFLKESDYDEYGST